MADAKTIINAIQGKFPSEPYACELFRNLEEEIYQIIERVCKNEKVYETEEEVETIFRIMEKKLKEAEECLRNREWREFERFMENIDVNVAAMKEPLEFLIEGGKNDD